MKTKTTKPIRILMNSAMMPAEGVYILTRVSRERFVEAMRAGFVSYIGYPDTAHFLERISGRSVPVNRSETLMFDGAIMLICKLKYRLTNPADKGRFTPSDADYEFFFCEYEAHEVQP